MTIRATASGSVQDAPLYATTKCTSFSPGNLILTSDPVNFAGSCIFVIKLIVIISLSIKNRYNLNNLLL